MKLVVKRANGDVWDLEGTEEELSAFVGKHALQLFPIQFNFAPPLTVPYVPPADPMPVVPSPFIVPLPPFDSQPFYVGGSGMIPTGPFVGAGDSTFRVDETNVGQCPTLSATTNVASA